MAAFVVKVQSSGADLGECGHLTKIAACELYFAKMGETASGQ
jgi:hypothetical protein